MTARVLVVDDVPANVRLLQARLSGEHFDVRTAHSGMEALTMLEIEPIDVVLLDVVMPGMDGLETCRRIKGRPSTMHIPVIVLTALDEPRDRVRGLEAGADDFLTKPIDDIALVTRVKNLARLKLLNDAVVRCVPRASDTSIPTSMLAGWAGVDAAGRILLVDDRERAAARVITALGEAHEVDLEPAPQAAFARLCGARSYDVLIVSLNLVRADALRLCGQAKADERTRHIPIIAIVEPDDEERLLRALDMGVNDYLVRPIDRSELRTRTRAQVRRKRCWDHLRARVEGADAPPAPLGASWRGQMI